MHCRCQLIEFKEPKEGLVLTPFEVALQDIVEKDGKKVSSIQIFKASKFKHPAIGNFELGEKDFDLFIKNFNDDVRKVKLAVNLDHKKEEAMGWMLSLEKRNDGRELWANIEWTERGVEKVSGKEYRYVSAEFHFVFEDNETGKKIPRVLTGAALTNYPFIKGMSPVEFAETSKPKERQEMKLSELIAELSNHGIDVRELQAIAKKHGDIEVKLSESVTELSTVKADLVKAIAERDGLKKKVEELDKSVAEAKFSELVKSGMKEGKLTKDFAEKQFREMFDKMGAEFAETYLAEMPKVVRSSMAGSSSKGDGEGSVYDKIQAAAAALCEKNTSLNLSDAISNVLELRPDLAKAYAAEFED